MSKYYKQSVAVDEEMKNSWVNFRGWLTNWGGIALYLAIAFGTLSRYDLRVVETRTIPRPHQSTITDYWNSVGGYIWPLFEEKAVASMLEHCDLHPGQVVVEIGPGSGALAEQILHRITNDGAISNRPQYYGVDVSETMHHLAKKRLQSYIDRGSAVVEKTDATHDYVDFVSVPVDRFVVSYVFDLLDSKEIERMLAIMKNKLRTNEDGSASGDAKICVVNFTYGYDPISRVVTNIWQMIYYVLGGGLFGGCRPLDMIKYLTPESGLTQQFLGMLHQYGMPSQIVVIGKKALGN
jgi:phospholipid N-methyltransferase